MYTEQVKNPNTQRYVNINSPLYNQLLKQYTKEELLKTIKKSANKELLPDCVIDKYVVIQKIGQGGSGCVYKAKYDNQMVVIKTQIDNNRNYLEREYQFYQKIKHLEGFPIIHDYFRHTPVHYKNKTYYGDFLVMSFLGKSLSECFHEHKIFSLQTTNMYGLQMLDRIEALHRLNILHCDIKPGNFVIQDKIYLIDFGLSAQVSEVAHSMNKFRGTKTYASRNVHKGITYSYRDDLESLVYMLIRFYTGKLPWDNFNSKIDIYHLKNKFVCCLEFKQFYDYVNNLKFNEFPDYRLLKSFLND